MFLLYNIITTTKNHITYDCNYHIIFCPKYRKKLLKDEIANDLSKYIESRTLEVDCKLKSFEVMEDHVHILVSIPPQMKVGSYVRMIKGGSAKLLRDKYKELKSKLPTLWTHSYFVSTTGGVNLEQVKKYIENQETQYEAQKRYSKK